LGEGMEPCQIPPDPKEQKVELERSDTGVVPFVTWFEEGGVIR